MIDDTGTYLVNPQYADMGDYASNGLLWFADDEDRIGYISTSGEEVIFTQFDYVFTYSSKYFDYSWADSFHDDGFAVVRMGDNSGVIDKTGKYVINPQFENIVYG